MRLKRYIRRMSLLKFIATSSILFFLVSFAIMASLTWPSYNVLIFLIAVFFLIVGVVAVEVRFPSDKPMAPEDGSSAAPSERPDVSPSPAATATSWLSGIRASSREADAVADRVEQLQAEKDQLQQITEGVSACVAHIDARGRCVYVNKRLLSCFEAADKEELLDVEYFIDVDGKTLSSFSELAFYLMQKPEKDVELSVPLGGHQRFFIGRASPAPADGSDGTAETTVSLVDITDRALADLRNRYYASHDPLTSVFNRIAFLVDLEDSVSAARGGRGVALIAMDLDRFKPINDEYGHTAGDTVLKVVAGRLKAVSKPHGSVYRVGGDEFMIIISGESVEAALAVAEQAVLDVSKPIRTARAEVSVGGSAGVAFMPEDASSARTLVELADKALYVSKTGGRGRVTRYVDNEAEVKAGSEDVRSVVRSADDP